jgi:TPR repeat protein
VTWYRKSAEQGSAVAQSNLGLMYANGEGVAENNVEAMKWFRKAAEQGNATAQFYLGVMYGKGKGVAQDYVAAHMWMNLARAQGNEEASHNINILVKKMTREDISKAQKMASEWQAKHSSVSN